MLFLKSMLIFIQEQLNAADDPFLRR